MGWHYGMGRLNDRALPRIILRSQEQEKGRRKRLEMEPVFCGWFTAPCRLKTWQDTDNVSVLPRPRKRFVKTAGAGNNSEHSGC